MNNAYQTLEALSLPLLQAYHADLTKHDKEAIEADRATPWLHWTRKYGTQILFLRPSNHPDWQANDNETVPFIFGHANRRHILEQYAGIASYFAKRHDEDKPLMVWYFNGRDGCQVTLEKAVEISMDWKRNVERDWNRESR
jgi:hypothetical protein